MGLYVVVRKHVSSKFREELDADKYPGSDAMIVKVPVTLPYQANFDAYDNSTGSSNGTESFTDRQVQGCPRHPAGGAGQKQTRS